MKIIGFPQPNQDFHPNSFVLLRKTKDFTPKIMVLHRKTNGFGANWFKMLSFPMENHQFATEFMDFLMENHTF